MSEMHGEVQVSTVNPFIPCSHPLSAGLIGKPAEGNVGRVSVANRSAFVLVNSYRG